MRLPTATPRILALFLAFVASAVYLNSLTNAFALDDVFIIELNARVHDLSDQRAIWLTPYWPFRGEELGLYRPGAIFMYAVQWALSGGEPWLFHAFGILQHALVTVLVFVLLARLTHSTPAFIGALVFAVHPVHVEAVANVVGQAEIVAALLVLTACLVHSGRPPGVAVSWGRRVVLVGLYLFAIAVKESAVVLPALLVIVDFAQRRVRLSTYGFAEYARALLLPLFLLAAALAFYLLVRLDVMAGSVTGVDAAPSMPYLREDHRVLNALRAFPEFLRLLFFPYDLAADYHPAVLLPVESVRPMVVLGAGLLVLLVFFALALPWLPHLGFAAAWFLISILTVSNLFFPIGVLVAERTLYLPSIALSALIAFAWHVWSARWSVPVRRVAPALVLAATTLLGARTWMRNPDWRTTDTILQAQVRDHPESYRSQWAIASTFRAAGDVQRAEAHFRLGERIYPRDAQFLGEYGELLLVLGRAAEAVEVLERAHALQPQMTQPVELLLHGYLAVGRFEDALRLAAAAESLGAERALTMPVRAAAWAGLGDYERAIAAWRVAIRSTEKPGWQWWAFLARSLALHSMDAEAASVLAQARAFTRDAAALALIDRTAQAVAAGCYDAATAERADMRDCDPLRNWIGVIARPRTNAATRVSEP